MLVVGGREFRMCSSWVVGCLWWEEGGWRGSFGGRMRERDGAAIGLVGDLWKFCVSWSCCQLEKLE